MRPSISLGHIVNHMSRYPGFALRIFKRIRLNATAILLEAGGRMFNEFSIFQAKGDDLACDRVGKGNICTDVEAGLYVGLLHGASMPRINGIETRSVPNSFEEMMKENRMCLPGI